MFYYTQPQFLQKSISMTYTEKIRKAYEKQLIINIAEKITQHEEHQGIICQPLLTVRRTDKFNNHQNKLKKIYKKYGNAKLHTLKFKLVVLKHKLCATSVKLKYQTIRYNQKLINQVFC